MDRPKNLEQLKKESFDLLIIGGGVTGAGIALDAASRRLKVALVEKSDFASGTSSRSTKLVHGGLRYLKQFEVGLVMEVGRERTIVHRNAPHLVVPERMLMPVVRGGTYGKYLSWIGLTVYDILAGVKRKDRKRMLSAKQAIREEPLLNPKGLRGAGLYAEYRTDDARLTIELVKTASRYGAVCVNYCKLEKFVYQGDRISGAQCRNEMNGEDLEIRASRVVNACGPWVDDIRKINGSITNKRLHLTKGVHLVVDKSKFPVNHSIYFDAPGGRMIFAIPRGSKTYFGTTDTDYFNDKDRILTTREDAGYLLQAVNEVFPDIYLSQGDVESCWAGLRPLIHQEGKSLSEISRRDEVFLAADGLITIAGGKLTGYREMAKKTVNMVTRSRRGCLTRKIPLSTHPLLDEEEVDAYRKRVIQQIRPMGLDPAKAKYLVFTYGRETDHILGLMPEFATSDPLESLIRSELQFTLEQEMVMNAIDFFDRRTGKIYFDRDGVQRYKEIIINDLAKYFHWTKDRIALETVRLENRIEECSVIQ